VREAVTEAITTAGFGGLDTVEETRRLLASLADSDESGTKRRD
jgi:hypothetical protein